MSEIKLKIVIDGKEAIAALNLTESEITDLKKSLGDVSTAAKNTGQSTASSFANFGNVITGLNQGLELARKGFDLLSKPLQAAGQFESYETSLKVMLGSTELAKQRLEELTTFAASTPFELPEVVTLGNQLQAIGRYSQENMTILGDLASAAGKPIDQVTGAFAKLATGQKGVAVDMFRDLLISTDDWVKATGKGVDKTGSLMATTEEMIAALPQIMSGKGFTGMMEEQSKTFNGMMSNFQDSIGGVMRNIGNSMLPLAKDIISVLTPAISGLVPVFGFLKDAIVFLMPMIGAVAAGFAAYAISAGISALATIYNTSVITAYGNYSLLTSAKIAIVTAGQWLWNAAMAANPIGLVIAGIALLIGGIALLADAFSESAQERLDDALATQEMVKAQKDSVKVQIDEKRGLKDLVDEYEKLASKKGKTAKETKRLDELYVIINDKYPGLVKSTGTFTDALDLAKNGSNKLTSEISNLTIAYDKLSAQALIASRNVAIGERDVAADLMDKTFKSTLEYEVTETDALINKVMWAEDKAFRQKIENAKTTMEVETAKLAYVNKLSELQKTYKDDLTAKEIDALNKTIVTVADGQKKIIELRPKTAQTLAEEEAEALRLKKLADAQKLADQKNDNKTTPKKELTGEKDLLALQKQEEALAKEDRTKTNLDRLNLEKEHLNEMLNFYKSYVTKDTDLKKELTDKTLDVTNNLAISTLQIENETNDERLKNEKEFNDSQLAYREQMIEDVAALEKDAMAELNRLEDQRIAKIPDEFNRQREAEEKRWNLLTETERNLESNKQEHADKKAEIDSAEMQNTIDLTASTLGQAKGMLGQHTAAYKAIAIAQATMDTYAGATAALKAGPIIGPILAGITVAMGLANVAKIVAVPTESQGFEKGGLLKKGQAGFIEGYDNEIIAPEKTFIDVMKEIVLPQAVKNNTAEKSKFVGDMKNAFTSLGDTIIPKMAWTPSPIMASAGYQNQDIRISMDPVQLTQSGMDMRGALKLTESSIARKR